MSSSTQNQQWTIEDSTSLYGVNSWGNDYFDIIENGDLAIKNPLNPNNSALPFSDIITGLQEREMQMPVLLRIENILDHSISQINDTFRDVIDKVGYNNVYRGVYPIKVNQQAQIVEEIADFGESYNHGLEVGSKAEMIAALSTLKSTDSLLICNGYKDQEFIELGLQATKLGFLCFFVIETPAELPIIIERSKALEVKPFIGVRMKMTSKVSGHWNSTSGDRSVFGLTTAQVIQVIDRLKEHGMLECLKLLHCHLGSQIPNIRDIRGGVVEACRYYIDLCKEGAALEYIDLGGGLAVDYTGEKSKGSQSRNYSLNEYCEDIVEAIKETLDADNIPHPTIITESGRATVAYSSILLFNILDVTKFEPIRSDHSKHIDHDLIASMREIFEYLNPKRVQECYNDAHFYRDEVRELFKRGQIDLRTRSVAENLFLEILQNIKIVLDSMDEIPGELKDLPDSLADIYYGNFSLFQSLPDSWAIDQVFPIMPVHRLNEKPERKAVIADITCDCDGKIDNFIAGRQLRPVLPLHEQNSSDEYYLGVFLVGAYQETLGDLHNLFGDTNVVSVKINPDNSYEFAKEIHGDSISDVLSYVEYNPKEMQLKFRNFVESAVKSGRITVKERQRMINTFSESMRGYTYYERDSNY